MTYRILASFMVVGVLTGVCYAGEVDTVSKTPAAGTVAPAASDATGRDDGRAVVEPVRVGRIPHRAVFQPGTRTGGAGGGASAGAVRIARLGVDETAACCVNPNWIEDSRCDCFWEACAYQELTYCSATYCMENGCP